MKCSTATLMLCLVLCGAARAAEGDTAYRDGAWHFEMIQPAGWLMDHPNERGVRVRFRDPQSRAVCNMTVSDAPDTAKLTQAQINTYVEGGVLAPMPMSELKALDPNVRLVHREFVHLKPASAQISEVTVSVGGFAEETYNLALSVPGRGYSGNCIVGKDKYPRMRPEFDRILRSLTVLP